MALNLTNDSLCINSGDTAFMLFSTTLVMMQTPAMGLAQAGLIRIKNVISMLIQILSGAGILSILWFMVGFSLTFGPS
jgi:ammonium transporter, Amt family